MPRPRMLSIVVGSLPLLLLLACGGDPPAETSCEDFAPPDASVGVPADVADVLERHCWSCHGRPVSGNAPMELVEWADFQGCRDPGPVPVYERMRIRINSERLPMPPILQPRMPEADQMILDAWAQDGAPPAP